MPKIIDKFPKDKTADTQEQTLHKKHRLIQCIGGVTELQNAPFIKFDEQGVCNACRYAEMKFGGGIDWEKREQELRELCDYELAFKKVHDDVSVAELVELT